MNEDMNLTCDGINEGFSFKPKAVYSDKDRKTALFVWIAAALFAHFVLWHTTGFITTLYFILIITASVFILKKNGCIFSKGQKIWTGVLYVFSLVFSITADTTAKGLTVAFLMSGGAYLVHCVSGGTELFRDYSPFDIKNSVLNNPFSCLGKIFPASISGEKKKGLKNAIYVMAGLLLAVPLTIVVGSLLMSADEGVERILSGVAEYIYNGDYTQIVWESILTLLGAMYLYGLFYSHTHDDFIIKADDDRCEAVCNNFRKMNNIIVYTTVTPICILYIIFFISQAAYFLSAFSGNLPAEYSYAEYARKGFFELSGIEAINAVVIFLMNFTAKNSGKNKSMGLKAYTIVISVFTLIITATALSKMVLYINEYGLTRLRLDTSWFMILTAFIFVLVIIKQFDDRLCFVKLSAIIFTFMFGVLCFGRFDSVIAKYNLTYKADTITYRDIEQMAEISADSAAVVSSPEYRKFIRNKIQKEKGWVHNEDYYIYSDNGNLDCILDDHIGYDIYRKMNISSLTVMNNLNRR